MEVQFKHDTETLKSNLGSIAPETENLQSNLDNSEETKSIKYDDIIKQLGEFGRYQKIIYTLVVLPTFFGAFPSMSVVFTIWERPFRCSIPELTNDSYELQGEWHERLLNDSLPLYDNTLRYSKCSIYKESNITDTISNTSRQEQTCDAWVYDESVIKTTVISELDLVCDKTLYASHAKMVYYFSVVFGALVWGPMADIFGRKPVFCFSVVLMLASNVATAWITDFTSFLIVRSLAGFANIGGVNTGFIIGIELVGPSKRRYAGLVIEFFWCAGEFYLLLMAYLFRDWKDLQLAGSVPMVLMVIYCWFVPESPRWLLSRGDTTKARKILLKFAKMNKASLSTDICKYKESDKGFFQIWSILRNTRLLLRLIIVSFSWLVSSMGYYGLTLVSGNLDGDVYINFFASSAMELIGYILCLSLMERLGRRAVLSGSFLIGGVACLCSIFPTLFSNQSLFWMIVMLSNIGKCCVSASISLAYVYTAELFPTNNRSAVLGIANVVGRLGAAICPYIADISFLVESKFGKALPVIIFGSVMLVGGFAALILPETLKKKLPENLDDALKLARKQTKGKMELIIV